MNKICVILPIFILVSLTIIAILNIIKILRNQNNVRMEQYEIDNKLMKHILEYIKQNRANELFKKTGMSELSNSEYLKIYQDNIRELSKTEQKKINKLTKSINKRIKKITTKENYQKWLSKKTEWKVIILENNEHKIEFNYPFTLGEYIFLRPNNLHYHDEKLKELLFHEYIHIIQRKHQEHFDEQYIKKLDFIKISNYQFENNFYKNIITNPDSPDNGWLVYSNHEGSKILFMPVLMMENNSTEEKAIILSEKQYPEIFKEIKKGNNYIKNQVKVVDNKVLDLTEIKEYVEKLDTTDGLYNPNEFLAYNLEESLYGDSEKFNKLIELYF